MKEYQLFSIFLDFCLYIIALIPTWISLFFYKNYLSKKKFLNMNYLTILIEIFIFIIIYSFPNLISSLITQKVNIQNYMMYSFKILFILSSISTIHYTIPIFLYKETKNLKYFLLFILKLLYIPIMLINFYIFNTKGLLFSVPLCDLFYSFYLIILFIKKTKK